MKMTRIIAMSIPVAIMLMSFARPAAAMKPEASVSTYHSEGTYADCSAVNPEWAFRIDFQGDAQEIITTHFDNNGDPDWLMYKWEYRGTAWNTVSGLTVRDNSNGVELWDLTTNNMKWSGYIYHWTIPGKGNVFFDTGHNVFHLDPDGVWRGTFSAGQHDFFEGYGIGGLEYIHASWCAALA